MDALIKFALDNITVVAGGILVLVVVGPYLLMQKKRTKKVTRRIKEAKEFGLYEPVTIHPKVNKDICIGSGACITACPEQEILGRVNNQAEPVYASRCVGHGACARACPIGAIELVFGTEKRGVDLPQVYPNFESNVKRLFIAGELGGMGLIKNAVLQGKEAMDYIATDLKGGGFKPEQGLFDIVIVGSGPAGLSGALQAKKLNLNYLLIEQEPDFGGAMLSYPRGKVVMTRPADIPLYGKVNTGTLSKEEILALWHKIVQKTGLQVSLGEKALSVESSDSAFLFKTSRRNIKCRFVLLAVGRRGTPRKLGVPGENLPKVMYRLIEPEHYIGQKILVVGGGDSAIESAIALSSQEKTVVTLSYRGPAFARIKPDNKTRIDNAVRTGKIKLLLESNVLEIKPASVILEQKGTNMEMPNDSIMVFAGGELPNDFLKACGVNLETKRGER